MSDTHFRRPSPREDPLTLAYCDVAIWLRRKHGLPSSQLKGFCDQGWRFADSGTVFLGASSVMIERYRYRGAKIPTPWAIETAANDG